MGREKVAEWVWRVVVVLLLGTIAWCMVDFATRTSISVYDGN
jgi:hypothetical protein